MLFTFKKNTLLNNRFSQVLRFVKCCALVHTKRDHDTTMENSNLNDLNSAEAQTNQRVRFF